MLKFLRPWIIFGVVHAFAFVLYLANLQEGLSSYFVPSQDYLLGYSKYLLFTISFICGGMLGAAWNAKWRPSDPQAMLAIGYANVALAFVGITVATVAMVQAGGADVVVDAFSGYTTLGELRALKVGGVVQAAHFLMPAGLGMVAFAATCGRCRVPTLFWIAVLVVVLFRSYVFVARLYLLWCFVPVIMVALVSLNSIYRRRAFYAAMLLSFLVILVFISQATIRSWGGDGDALEYGMRMLGEYIFGGFHLASALASHPSPMAFPTETLRFLSTIGDDGEWIESIDYAAFEATYGRQGFNTYGVFGTAYLDFGDFAFLYAAVYGLLSGVLYRMYRRHSYFGIVLYPILCVYILDSVRINALAVTQGVIPLVGALISFIAYRALERRRNIACERAFPESR